MQFILAANQQKTTAQLSVQHIALVSDICCFHLYD